MEKIELLSITDAKIILELLDLNDFDCIQLVFITYEPFKTIRDFNVTTRVEHSLVSEREHTVSVDDLDIILPFKDDRDYLKEIELYHKDFIKSITISLTNRSITFRDMDATITINQLWNKIGKYTGRIHINIE